MGYVPSPSFLNDSLVPLTREGKRAPERTDGKWTIWG